MKVVNVHNKSYKLVPAVVGDCCRHCAFTRMFGGCSLNYNLRDCKGGYLKEIKQEDKMNKKHKLADLVGEQFNSSYQDSYDYFVKDEDNITCALLKADCIVVNEEIQKDIPECVAPTIDSHYNFNYTLTENDIKNGSIKLDPYFVANQWKIGEKDNSGVVFHIFKTCARFSVKNSKEREIIAIYKSIKRLAELEGISFD